MIDLDAIERAATWKEGEGLDALIALDLIRRGIPALIARVRELEAELTHTKVINDNLWAENERLSK